MSETVTIKTWKEVKQKIISLNPSIGKEIDSIPGVDDFKIIQAQYPFGAPIERRGLFHLNFDGDIINYKNSAIPHEIRDLLDYDWLGMPFGIVTHNTFESHFDMPSHVIPFRLLQPGFTFSLLSIFDKKGATNNIVGAQSATAGCRSLITLPSIAHFQYNERLAKKFHLDEILCPKSLADQWRLFTSVANAKSFRSQWHTELVFFEKRFVEALETQHKLKADLLSYVWYATGYARHSDLYDLTFSSFTEDCLTLSTKNSDAVIETVKHVLKIGLKVACGFTPSTTEMAGPISGLTKALLDVYRIRFYLPLFMQIGNYDGNKPIYYSLQRHTFVHTIPQKSASNNKTIKELGEIKRIIDQYKDYILNHKSPFSLKSTALYKMLKDVEFDFFHPQGESEGLNPDIQSICDEDKRFMKLINKFPIDKDLKFPEKSIFFNGCIRLRPARK